LLLSVAVAAGGRASDADMRSRCGIVLLTPYYSDPSRHWFDDSADKVRRADTTHIAILMPRKCPGEKLGIQPAMPYKVLAGQLLIV
jgi:hypothetical protein